MNTDKKHSEAFDRFISLHGESDTFTNTLDNGNQEAQANGCFGITHSDMIDSWLDFLDHECRWCNEGSEEKELYNNHYYEILYEITGCNDWHYANGSLNDEI